MSSAVVTESMPPARCIVCDATSFHLRLRKQERDIWRCAECGLETQHPIPRPEALGLLYEREYAQGFGVDYLREADLNALRARLRYQQLAPRCKPGRWLDIGCASGEFVAAARAGGQDACGIDLASNAVALGLKRGLPLRAGRLEDLGDAERFDTITAFDVIEHVPDPAGLLANIRERLAPGGTVALTTPNLRSWTRFLLGKKWLFYLPDLHLFYFDPHSISLLLRRAGLQRRSIGPCFKHVTLTGVADELRLHPGVVWRIAERILRVLPRSIRDGAIPLGLGEMLVIAQGPE